jgi:hypothetical protein
LPRNVGVEYAHFIVAALLGIARRAWLDGEKVIPVDPQHGCAIQGNKTVPVQVPQSGLAAKSPGSALQLAKLRPVPVGVEFSLQGREAGGYSQPGQGYEEGLCTA